MEWFRKFMTGRYGMDQLNFGIFGASIVVAFISMFFHNGLISIFSWILFILYFFRVFSKNTAKRYKENELFLTYLRPLQGWFNKKKSRLKDSKTHKYFTCPNCKQTIRVPKGKGKISISCPKCRNEFIKKT